MRTPALRFRNLPVIIRVIVAKGVQPNIVDDASVQERQSRAKRFLTLTAPDSWSSPIGIANGLQFDFRSQAEQSRDI
jgi:hypothetical protein